MRPDKSLTERLVRINSPQMASFFALDLEALRPVLDQIDAIVLPKVESREHVKALDEFLTKHSKKDIKVRSQHLPHRLIFL